MRVVQAAVLLALLTLTSCAPSAVRPVSAVAPNAGGRAGRVPPPKVDKLVVTTSDGSWHLATLDSARVDSLRQAGVILQQDVDDPLDMVFVPQLQYPRQARRECVQGRVIVQGVIGRDGRAEPGSIGIRMSVDPRFNRPAFALMEHATFRPGTLHGAPVRTLVDVPIDFKIRGAC